MATQLKRNAVILGGARMSNELVEGHRATRLLVRAGPNKLVALADGFRAVEPLNRHVALGELVAVRAFNADHITAFEIVRRKGCLVRPLALGRDRREGLQDFTRQSLFDGSLFGHFIFLGQCNIPSGVWFTR